ncbi:MAG: hypothetical protein WBL25_15935 [Anaerolineales bacterium]
MQTFLASAADSFPHDECLTCECFLGYVMRLRLDSDEHGREIVANYQVEKQNIHSCLGCDPCLPADLYTEYIRKRQPPLITIL